MLIVAAVGVPALQLRTQVRHSARSTFSFYLEICIIFLPFRLSQERRMVSPDKERTDCDADDDNG